MSMVNRYRENADKQGEDGKGPLRLFGVGLMLRRPKFVRWVGEAVTQQLLLRHRGGFRCALPTLRSYAALLASLTISSSIASPASTSSSSVMREKPLRLIAPPRASGGM